MLAAIQADDRVEVEHNGCTAFLTPPVGMVAVEYIQDARALHALRSEPDKQESAGMEFVARWFHRLMPDVESPRDAWRVFLALGGFAGPVPETMVRMTEQLVGASEEAVDDLPTSPAGPELGGPSS